MNSISTMRVGGLDSSELARNETSSLRAGMRVLGRDEVMRLERRSGIKRIEIKAGIVWLTSTPAKGDLLLKAGDVFECEKNWPYVLQGLEASEFSCSFG
jgi:hypothetical protein